MAYFRANEGQKQRKSHFNPTQVIGLTFAAIILLGTVLLMLPGSSRSGESCGILPALFTATSATCVTGLSLFDTWTQWSGFGQAVILALIEVGGLGFMSAASVLVFLLRRKVGLKQRMIMAQSLNPNDLSGVVRLQKWVLKASLLIQLGGALILTVHFLPAHGMKQSVIWGVFHAVSAFCNAGFDIFGSIAPGASVIPFQSDPVVCITLMVLIVVGGLGFFVWDELVHLRRFRKFSVYTKLVLVTTGALILLGAGCFLLLEWNNPGTLGPLGVGDKILNALFQSVGLRTAGFASVDQGKLTEAGKAVSVVFMLIGGSSGSTAGGIKTVTVVVLLLFLLARIRGRSTVNVFHRTILAEKVLDAVTIAGIVAGLSLFGAIFISSTSDFTFTDSLFEAASALGTVGYTAGGTGSLNAASQILLIVYMYFGRVGVLTISLGFLMGDRAQERYRYAHTNLLIG